jgi:hypothetical protein
MTWEKDGNLKCGGCRLIFDFPGPRVEVLRAARAHGWHCYEGPSLTGLDLASHLCETCIGSARTRLPKIEVLQPQDPLF